MQCDSCAQGTKTCSHNECSRVIVAWQCHDYLDLLLVVIESCSQLSEVVLVFSGVYVVYCIGAGIIIIYTMHGQNVATPGAPCEASCNGGAFLALLQYLHFSGIIKLTVTHMRQ